MWSFDGLFLGAYNIFGDMNLSMFIPLDVIAMRKSIFVQHSSLDLDIAKARPGNIELSEYWCHIGCLSWGVSIRPHPPPPSQLNSYRLHTILIHILLIYICFREKTTSVPDLKRVISFDVAMTFIKRPFIWQGIVWIIELRIVIVFFVFHMYIDDTRHLFNLSVIYVSIF